MNPARLRSRINYYIHIHVYTYRETYTQIRIRSPVKVGVVSGESKVTRLGHVSNAKR